MPTSTIQPAVPASMDARRVRYCPTCGEPMIGTPVFECEHGHQWTPRCYTYRSGGQYYAECLDFSLISRGDTEAEAIGRLQEQMFAYLETVLDGGPTRGLLPRPAPLRAWIRYYALLFWRRLTRRPAHVSTESGVVVRLSRC